MRWVWQHKTVVDCSLIFQLRGIFHKWEDIELSWRNSKQGYCTDKQSEHTPKRQYEDLLDRHMLKYIIIEG